MHTHTQRFDWITPPLTENQRLHWRARARVVKDVRAAGRLAFARMRGHRHVEVTLVWVVADRRRRDEDNITPTLKALCDGMVDAGVVPDDTPQFMAKNMPRIEYRPGSIPHVEVTVTATP